MFPSATDPLTLFQRLIDGDQSVFTELVRCCGSKVRRIIRRYLDVRVRSLVDPADVEQVVWINFLARVTESAASLRRSPQELQALLWHMACCETLMISRHQRRQKRDCRRNASLDSLTPQQLDELLDPRPGPQEHAIGEDLRDCLDGELKRFERAVLDLLLLGCTNREIARRLKVSKTKVHRVVKQIATRARRLRDEGRARPGSTTIAAHPGPALSQTGIGEQNPPSQQPCGRGDVGSCKPPSTTPHISPQSTSGPVAMKLRYLVGPITTATTEHWRLHREQGICRLFARRGPADVHIGPGDSWDTVLAQLPDGWRPDFILLDLAYTTVPACLWDAPVPLVALAPDWQWQWHYLRLAVPRCALVLTDVLGVDALHRQGIAQARQANLFGLQGLFTTPAPLPDPPRDIDILFIGNLHHAVQRERLAWLGRLGKLASRWRVHIEEGVEGEEYRTLLRRSRIVFNRSARGEWNLRVGEAASCSALLFSEAGNREMPGVWQHGVNCVFYDDENLEKLLEHYLTHEQERAAIACAGQQTAAQHTFERSWQKACEQLKADFPTLLQRHAQRPPLAPHDLLYLRLWQALRAGDTIDPTLPAALETALAQPQAPAFLHAALGLAEAAAAREQNGSLNGESLQRLAARLHRTVQATPRNKPAALDLIEVLAALGQRDLAISGARQLLAMHGPLDTDALNTPHFPSGFNLFRVEWERAAWQNAGRPDSEQQAKQTLLRWRLHSILADHTGELVHFHEAALARPDLSVGRAALGCALARQQRFADAVPHLEAAVAADPFDTAAARALFQALTDAGHTQAAQEVARDRALLHLAAPRHVAAEPWHTPAATGSAAASPSPSALDASLLVRWQGPMLAQHPLAHVNRHIARELAALGCGVRLADVPSPAPPIEPGPLLDFVHQHLDRPLARPADVCVRHAWPLDVCPPKEGRWVVFQPWEYGSIPTRWLAPLRDLADEVWVPSSFVKDGFVQSGVPAEKVQVIPLGVDPAVFNPDVKPFLVPTEKKFKFLFVGGTIHRKGIDVLLRAYAQFYRGDQVCLVIKDTGVGSFYCCQTSGELIGNFRSHLEHPEIVYLDGELTQEEMAGLYRACDCLVMPYRGEGFCLPVAEAMACGLPVIVTGYGPVLDYCDEESAFFIPAKRVPFHEKRVGDLDTVDFPHLVEPDGNELRSLMRQIIREPQEARKRAEVACRRVHETLTWQHTARLVQQRLQTLAQRPARRQTAAPTRSQVTVPAQRTARQTTSLCIIAKNEEDNLGACLHSARDLFDEIIVLDTGSTDRTREIALAHGAKVFDFPWIDHFAAARNACLEHATGDFIFWLDADDRLDDVNRAKLRALLASLPPRNVALSMKCHCLPAPGQDAGTLVDHIRLFRNDPRIRWRYRIHEQILGAVRESGGEVYFADVVITHTGYADPALRGRKLQRDLRLLEMEYAEQPHDPFTLFNLGQACAELRQYERAAAMLQESLQRSHPSDSIVRKLYVLLSNCQLGLRRPDVALDVCLKGQSVCPDDAELLFLESALRGEQGDLYGAKAALVRLLGTESSPHFASVTDGLRGHKGRHQLAVVCLRLGEYEEAEGLWHGVLRERPDFRQGWLGLGDLYLAQGRWSCLDELDGKLSQLPGGDLEATLLKARAHRARGEFGPGRSLLEDARQRWPESLPVLMQYSYLLLQMDTDHALADSVLAEILARDPANDEARNNRQVLQQRWQACAGSGPQGSPGTLPIPAPTGNELASLLILCCNEVDYTRLCLESVLRHTRQPYELILVDNGSTDGTPALLEALKRRAGPARVEVIRNDTNVGFPAGCNQALARAHGDYLVFLNNDTVVTPGWLDGLIAVLRRDWPEIGMVGPVSNYTAPPQLVKPGYHDLAGLEEFSVRRAREFADRTLEHPRLTGFCLLARRDVLQQVGGYDERFGLGFFDDDDLGLRVRQAGFRLVVALAVYIHHFGSRTFAGLGIDTGKQLADNLQRFRDKWGEEAARPYRLPDEEPLAHEYV
jgi:RNA polymerase sigma factor (sigma-70 family)